MDKTSISLVVIGALRQREIKLEIELEMKTDHSKIFSEVIKTT